MCRGPGHRAGTDGILESGKVLEDYLRNGDLHCATLSKAHAQAAFLISKMEMMALD